MNTQVTTIEVDHNAPVAVAAMTDAYCNRIGTAETAADVDRLASQLNTLDRAYGRSIWACRRATVLAYCKAHKVNPFKATRTRLGEVMEGMVMADVAKGIPEKTARGYKSKNYVALLDTMQQDDKRARELLANVAASGDVAAAAVAAIAQDSLLETEKVCGLLAMVPGVNEVAFAARVPLLAKEYPDVPAYLAKATRKASTAGDGKADKAKASTAGDGKATEEDHKANGPTPPPVAPVEIQDNRVSAAALFAAYEKMMGCERGPLAVARAAKLSDKHGKEYMLDVALAIIAEHYISAEA